MTTILWWLLQNTITVAVLVAIVAVLCRPLRTRPAVQHALWLVVLVKFITPPVVVWPWSARSLAAALSLDSGVEQAKPNPRTYLDLDVQSRQTQPTGGSGSVFEPTTGLHPIPDDGGVEDSMRTLEDSTPATLPQDALGERVPLDAGDAEILENLSALIRARDAESGGSLNAHDLQPDGEQAGSGDGPAVGVVREAAFARGVSLARSILVRRHLDRLPPLVFGVWLAGG